MAGYDIMYERLTKYEELFGQLTPREKAVFFFAYSQARVDAMGAKTTFERDGDTLKIDIKPYD